MKLSEEIQKEITKAEEVFMEANTECALAEERKQKAFQRLTDLGLDMTNALREESKG